MRTYYLDMRKHAPGWLLIGVGGAAGTLARDLVGETLLVNLLGALLLGVATGTLRTERVRALVAVGFLGAFTTFSTVALELARFAEDGRAPVAVAYATASAVGGIALAAAGMAAGARLRSR